MAVVSTSKELSRQRLRASCSTAAGGADRVVLEARTAQQAAAEIAAAEAAKLNREAKEQARLALREELKREER